MILDEKHVKIENAMILWDSVTKPEQGENGLRYKLKIGMQANNPAIAELDQLARACLNESKWKGAFPAGGHWPLVQIKPGQYLDVLPGGYSINPSTTRPVDVWDDSGNKIDAMQYPNYIYPGQVVSVIVHCWEYDNKQKGIATDLDGVQIQVAQGAPRQAFGGDGYDASAVFGTSGAMPPAGPGFMPGAVQPGAMPGAVQPGVPGPNANWMPPA